MTGSGKLRVVLTTIDGEDAARALAASLVEKRLAACVNLVPRVTSVFRWEGRIEQADEVLVVIKTDDEGVERIERFFEDEHPYDVPELIAIAPSNVGEDYARWVVESLGV